MLYSDFETEVDNYINSQDILEQIKIHIKLGQPWALVTSTVALYSDFENEVYNDIKSDRVIRR